MSRITKKICFVFMILIVFGGSAWGGWFKFEPNIILLDGTAVALELKDIEKKTAYTEKGDTAQVNELIKHNKVHIIQSEKDQTRVEYVDHEESEGRIFIRVKNESGSKLWTNMLSLACVGKDGKQRNVTKQDLTKEEFEPLPNVTN
ncbi:MAG: hypothetical protein KOO65_00590 [Desulfobacterales bacterium]|nr:hypothetical protein [Desulfobacterales bacterium]MBU8909739.1 hypothetical protein [Desulfobacterales bacterium]